MVAMPSFPLLEGALACGAGTQGIGKTSGCHHDQDQHIGW